MKEDRFEFTVELAGIPVGISCRYAENRVFFKDYITDKAPAFTVCPADDDMRAADKMIKEEYNAGYPDRVVENTALHYMIAERLADRDILLMHGSAICVDGKAYIFTAPSGTGKSTHAALWRKAFKERAYMINDDKPLLKITDGGVEVYGTPWNGKHMLGGNVHAPLKAVAELTRAKENSIEKISKSEAFAVLHGQSFRVENKLRMIKILGLEHKTVDRVKFYRLHVNMEPDAATVAYNGMNENEEGTL